jgi:hypothetical protein
MVSHSYRSQSETRVPNFYKPWDRHPTVVNVKRPW